MMGMGGMGGFNPAAVQLRKTGGAGARSSPASHPSPAPPAAKPPANKYGAAPRNFGAPAAPAPKASYGGGARGGASQDNTADLLDDIQKLKARIDDLERENAELRQENEELKSQARSGGGGGGGGPARGPSSYGGPAKATPKPPAAAPYKKAAAPPPPAPVHQAPDGEPFKALYTFNGEQPGDLQFKKGDIIYVQKKEGSWWEGTCNGNYGPFPSNYVTKA